MVQLCFASHNDSKISEIQELAGKEFLILTLKDCGITAPIPETGITLEENAKIKAEFAYKRTIVHCFADDSGLEVEALNGAPGVHSARYAGPDCDPEKNIGLLLDSLNGNPNRKARFRTVIHLIFDKTHHVFEGAVNGHILDQRRGNGGFGYDPVFVPDGHTRTFAEMLPEEKNAISHRALAFNQLVEFLKTAQKTSI